MIITFDLDDTLYPEIEYVKSGFREVSYFLEGAFHLSSEQTFKEMSKDLKSNGRGLIFDNLLNSYGIYSKKNVAKCLSIYRNHSPRIQLSPSAKRCLDRLDKYNKYLVTDGNLLVQRHKISSLNIKKYFKKIIPTHQYGLNAAKPSIKCFKKIINWEKCKPSEVVYIGDNPKKDFVNLKKAGIKTVRVLTGPYKNLNLDSSFEANYIFTSLDKLTLKFFFTLENQNK